MAYPAYQHSTVTQIKLLILSKLQYMLLSFSVFPLQLAFVLIFILYLVSKTLSTTLEGEVLFLLFPIVACSSDNCEGQTMCTQCCPSSLLTGMGKPDFTKSFELDLMLPQVPKGRGAVEPHLFVGTIRIAFSLLKLLSGYGCQICPLEEFQGPSTKDRSTTGFCGQ